MYLNDIILLIYLIMDVNIYNIQLIRYYNIYNRYCVCMCACWLNHGICEMPVFYFLSKYVYSKLHVISIQTLPGHNKKKKKYKIRNKTKRDNGLLLINLIPIDDKTMIIIFFLLLTRLVARVYSDPSHWIHRL